jgi:hypothetical protein
MTKMLLQRLFFKKPFYLASLWIYRGLRVKCPMFLHLVRPLLTEQSSKGCFNRRDNDDAVDVVPFVSNGHLLL